MNILEEIIIAKRKANIQSSLKRAWEEGIESRHVSRTSKQYLVKNRAVWCPNCQRWVMPDLIICCSECYHEIPELNDRWEEKTGWRF